MAFHLGTERLSMQPWTEADAGELSALWSERDSGTPGAAPGRERRNAGAWPRLQPGAGVLDPVGRGSCYLLSASTRRSTSSSTLPVLGRLRRSSRSLSSALVLPS